MFAGTTFLLLSKLSQIQWWSAKVDFEIITLLEELE